MGRNLLGTLAGDVLGQFTTFAFTVDITLADETTVKRVTTHPFSKTVDGNLYTASGVTISRIRFGFNEDRPSGELVVGTIDGSPIDIDDVKAGIYRSATFEIGIYNYAEISPIKTVLFSGVLGRANWDDNELSVRFDLKGCLRTGQKIIVWKNTPNCKASLGDWDCQLPVIEDPSVSHITVRADSTAYTIPHHVRVFQSSSYNDRIFELTTAGTSAATAPTFDLTIGNTTTDGTAVWTTRDSWVREATVASVIDIHKFTVTVSEARAVDGWFGGQGRGTGLAIFRDNNNINRHMEIIDWVNSTSQVQLAAPMPYAVEVGDKLDLIPACSKQFEFCWDTFDHGEWFVGEPFKGPAEQIDVPI